MSINPNNKMPAIADVEDKYELVSHLWAGTEAMRDAGTQYLPKEPEENSTNYARRLESTVLFPAYRNAVTSTVGKLFKGEMEVNNASPSLLPLLKDIDEDSNDLETFSQFATQSAIHYGCSYILVDYPIMNENATLEDEKLAGAQPYWVLLEAPQVLEASPVKAGGKNRLGIFRFMEREAYRVGEFEVSYRDRVKEFCLMENNTVMYRVFIKQDNKWVLRNAGQLLGLTDIPVVPLYTNKVGYFIGSPLFYDLAEENVLNWKMRSDYNNIVHHSQVPMLQIKGVQSAFDDNGLKQEITISPNSVFEFTSKDTDASWVEVSGSASTVGREALQDSYSLMTTLSLEALEDGMENQTATAAMLNAEESNATLRVIEDNIEIALNKAIDFTYNYLTVPNPGTTVELSTVEDELVDEATPNLPNDTLTE